MAAPLVPLTSVANARIKDVVRLRQKRHRDERRLMIIEEPLVIRRALEAGISCREVYACPQHLEDADQPLLAELLDAPGIQAFSLTPVVMAKIAYRDQPQGLLVVADAPSLGLENIPLPDRTPALILILEAVEKPGNLGAIQRVADGAGAQGIIVCGDHSDPWNPNVLRASRGACFAVPTVQAETPRVLAWLSAHHFLTVSTSPTAATLFDGIDLTGPVAIFLGTEHEGLSSGLLEGADRTVSIPMCGIGDSLNVSTAAAILLYESVRQRSITKKEP